MSPWDRSRYPPDWEAISRRIRFVRAASRCECRGECGRDHGGRCAARHGDLARNRKGKVVLTVAHLWRGPCKCALESEGQHCGNPDHLKAFCQACHLLYDLPLHRRNAAATRDRKRGQLRLPFLIEGGNP